MAAALLHHRKLKFSDDDDIEQQCAPICNYPTRFVCPVQCLHVCPSICADTTSVNTPPANVDPAAFYVVVSLPLIMTTLLVCGCLSIFRWSSRQSQPPAPQELYGAVDRRRWYVGTAGGLHSSVINAIAIRRYKKGEGAVEGLDCAVCLSEFQEDEILRILPNCKHGFHVQCIDTWLKSHTNCPVCRAGVESSGNSDVVLPAVVVLNREHGGIPVNNGGEREDYSEGHHEFRSSAVMNEKEDESTVQNVVPKNNIVEHS